jgi:hypothetical protein
MSWTPKAVLASLAVLALGLASDGAAAPDAAGQAPTAKDWTALSGLPDWSGVWIPDIPDQNAQVRTNPTPWTADAQRQIDRMNADEEAGNPKGLFINCLPEGMPSWMLISHNAMEVLFTPGRVTLLGESDGNRLRRIYTDGRPLPTDPDPSFHGYSVGRWEGDALVVDTIGVTPEAYIAISEAAGMPNNGDLRVIERIHLNGPDTLADDLEITAPHVLARPWKTTRLFHRRRGAKNDILEGVCLQGGMSERKDKDGNAVFEPLPHDQGIPVPPGP